VKAESFLSLWSTGADFIQLNSSAFGHLAPAQALDASSVTWLGGSRAAMKLPRSVLKQWGASASAEAVVMLMTEAK
jgi:hypothetical protein